MQLKSNLIPQVTGAIQKILSLPVSSLHDVSDITSSLDESLYPISYRLVTGGCFLLRGHRSRMIASHRRLYLLSEHVALRSSYAFAL